MKIVMLIGSGKTSKYMYNGLKNDFNIIKVFEENPSNRIKMIKRRIKKMGYFKVFGQILFIAYSKFMSFVSKDKIKNLVNIYKLSDEDIDENKVIYVDSINCQALIDNLIILNPDVVVVDGTRIISEKVLNSIKCIFLNTHSGITPKYRGVHGAYWAIANNDIKNCGTTVHLVDKGIDTGGILYQDTIKIDKTDNYCTYPIHQTKVGIELMSKALTDISNGEVSVIKNGLESTLYSHPDIVTYIKNFIKYRAK